MWDHFQKLILYFIWIDHFVFLKAKSFEIFMIPECRLVIIEWILIATLQVLLTFMKFQVIIIIILITNMA